MNPRRVLFLCLACLAVLPFSARSQPTEAELAELVALQKRADDLRAQRQYREALVSAQELLRRVQRLTGSNDVRIVAHVNRVANLLGKVRDYPEAVRHYEESIRIIEEAEGAESSKLLLPLSNLALLLDEMGEYGRSESTYQRALVVADRDGGLDATNRSVILSNFGLLYHHMGRLDQARAYYEKALELTPEVPQTLYSVGLLYSKIGEYEKAERRLRQALAVIKGAPQLDEAELATALNNLGGFYKHLGVYPKAVAYWKEALEIRERVLGDHPRTANSLDNLGALYRIVGDYAAAEKVTLRAVDIYEKMVGTRHPDTATAWQNLAATYDDLGKTDLAERYYLKVLNLRKETLDPHHPDLAGVMHNLANLYFYRGEVSRARELVEKALAISLSVHGPDHRATLQDRHLLELICLASNEKERALVLEKANKDGRLKAMSNLLSFATEQDRLSYQSDFDPYQIFATLGDGAEVAQAALQYKGVIAESLLEERQIAGAEPGPEYQRLIERWRAGRQSLLQLTLESSRGSRRRDFRKQEMPRATAEVETLESEIARHVSRIGGTRRALRTTIAQVQSVLPTNSALVEFISYRHAQGTNRVERRYGAAVIRPSGTPSWVAFGAATRIDEMIGKYAGILRQGSDEAKLRELLQALHQNLWRPIEAALPPGTREILLCPDGELNFLSFATLLGEDNRFVAEKYSLRFIASGRNLLRTFDPAPKGLFAIYANPAFGATVATNQALLAQRDFQGSDLNDLQLQPLPGADREGRELFNLAKGLGWPTAIYRDDEASEQRLREQQSPAILHLSTHGFFLSSGRSRQAPVADLTPGDETMVHNPMLRSGVALAGAQRSLDLWKQGIYPPAASDGIVSAEEVSLLKLGGTWLVTLAACDTGLGEVRRGEGVLGLRRAFVQAGAQNLLMALWRVDDVFTAGFIPRFYERAMRDRRPASALADLQREELVRLRRERDLLSAVRLAGPFVLSAKGP
jgi:tetratricopeptide (TPR) repeat protein/CHAT domain-containing protein